MAVTKSWVGIVERTPLGDADPVEVAPARLGAVSPRAES